MSENSYPPEPDSGTSDNSSAPDEHPLVDEVLSREVEEAMAQMSLGEEAALIADEDLDPHDSRDAVRRGTVVAIHGDDVFIDLGEKAQAVALSHQRPT